MSDGFNVLWRSLMVSFVGLQCVIVVTYSLIFRLNNLVPNYIKGCPTKRSAHHIHIDKTMHDLLAVPSKKRAPSAAHYRPVW